jgi:hypothetical protein
MMAHGKPRHAGLGQFRALAMKVTGHRSAEVFRRYNIIDEPDIRQAQRQVAAYREASRQRRGDRAMTAGKHGQKRTILAGLGPKCA